jgi:hypothetical protein
LLPFFSQLSFRLSTFIFTIFVYFYVDLSAAILYFRHRMTQNTTSSAAAASENCGMEKEKLSPVNAELIKRAVEACKTAGCYCDDETVHWHLSDYEAWAPDSKESRDCIAVLRECIAAGLDPDARLITAEDKLDEDIEALMSDLTAMSDRIADAIDARRSRRSPERIQCMASALELMRKAWHELL